MSQQPSNSSRLSHTGGSSEQASGSSSLGADRPHCDPKAAIQRLAGAVDLYRELVVAFFASADDSIQHLRSAAQQDNAEELHRAAHQLRGVAATCGALGVVDLTEKLEQMGRSRNLDGSLALCDELVAEIQNAHRELGVYLG